MEPTILGRPRLSRAKRAFSTRRVPGHAMRGLLADDTRPRTGDLVLARVDEIGKQAKLELTDGRKAHMFPGDEIVVCYGNRYAPDQYEALIGPDLSPCDLVAAGGLASIEVSRRVGLLPPTRITPLGLVTGADGQRLNVMQYCVDAPAERPAIPAILSLGTSMNAGKTLTATSLVRGFKRLGFKVAALKVTGTGAGGDMWIVRDAGADVSLDFTDAGYASTYLVGVPEIEAATYRLMNHAASLGCEVAVIEIADGLQQLETSQLVRSARILDVTVGSVFAAYDAMGAKYGVDILRAAGHAVLGISGRLGRSPLGVREAEDETGLRVYSPWDLQEGALVPVLRAHAVATGAALAHPFLDKLVRMPVPSDVALRNLVPIGSNGARAQAAGLSGTTLARDILERAARHVMTHEADMLCGARFGTRHGARSDWRNGVRLLEWMTDFGRIDLRVPRLKRQSYIPVFIQKATAPVAAVNAVIAARGDELRAAVSALVAALQGGSSPLPDAPDDLASEIGALIDAAQCRGLPVIHNAPTQEWCRPATVADIRNAPFGDYDDGFDEEDPDYPGAVPAEAEIDTINLVFQRDPRLTVAE